MSTTSTVVNRVPMQVRNRGAGLLHRMVSQFLAKKAHMNAV
jgi:hypothetical protein